MDTATQTHLTQLRSALLYQRAELRADVHAGMPAQRQAELQVKINALADVDAALQRLDQGVYGDCADCGEPVGLAHLLVLPAARYCSHCQHLHGQSGAGIG